MPQPPRDQPDLSHLSDQYELTEEELARTLDAVIASHPAGEDIWVFGYGSLMWKPEFEFVERHRGVVHGFHRGFCVYSHVWRGSRESPGLVLGLDRGGCCEGVVYRVAAERVRPTLEALIRREMVTRVYMPRWVRVRLGARTVRAHTYTAARDHTQYAGRLPPEEIVRLVRHGTGRGGDNLEYLLNTVAHMDDLGIADRPLRRIRALLAEDG